MLKKIFALSAIVFGALALTGTAYALVYKTGSNYVTVDKCEQIGSDIRVKRFNQTYNLTSTCRNAGHGNRQYAMKCISPTKYFVSWTDGCTPTPAPTPVPAPKPVEVYPVVQISKTNSWLGGNSQEVVATASNCGINDYIDHIEIYKTLNVNTNSDSVKSCAGAVTACAHTFENNTSIQNNFYVFATARCHYSGKMAKSDDLYMSLAPASSIANISANAKSYMEGGISYVELLGAATGNNNISSVEIYWGHDNNKTSGKLIKKCVTNNASTNNCVLTYPTMLSSSGWLWAKVWYNNANKNTETGMNYYSF